MLYDSEYWVIEKNKKQWTSVVEMRMPRWMRGMLRENRIGNEYVRGSIGVVSIVDKMRENRLR